MNGQPVNKEADKRLERKLSLAHERDTRVIITKTYDTLRVLDIVKSADRGIRLLRSNLLINPSFTQEEVIPRLAKYQEAVEKLHIATAEIYGFLIENGIKLQPYRPPRGMELPVLSAGEGKENNHIEQAEVAADGGKKKKEKIDKN